MNFIYYDPHLTKTNSNFAFSYPRGPSVYNLFVVHC